MATGNVEGPAKASAAAALAELKKIRAAWQSLASSGLSDMGQKAGGGGGGGGGGGNKDKLIDPKAYLHELDRWYTLLQ